MTIGQEKKGIITYTITPEKIIQILNKDISINKLDSLEGHLPYNDASISTIQEKPYLILNSKNAKAIVQLNKKGNNLIVGNTACHSKLSSECKDDCYPLSDCTCSPCKMGCIKYSF